MAGINYGRVALGGLAGGVVANACDFVTNTFLLTEDMRRMSQRLNLDWSVVSGPSTAVTWIAIDFVYATIIVWVYAAILPRLGSGKQTAMVAALVPFLSVTAILFGFVAMGVFTQDTFMKATFFSLITSVLASLAGTALYRD
jgi:hypothetical protein